MTIMSPTINSVLLLTGSSDGILAGSKRGLGLDEMVDATVHIRWVVESVVAMIQDCSNAVTVLYSLTAWRIT